MEKKEKSKDPTSTRRSVNRSALCEGEGMKQRKPKDLESYVTPEEVAQALEDAAKTIRREKGTTRIKLQIQFWYYYPDES